jgi:sugar lactone lactonase YvrE
MKVVAIMSTLLAVAGSLASSRAAGAVTLRTVATFDRSRGETPENLVVAGDGTVYVSLAFASTIARVAPDGTRASAAIPTAGGITVGLARHLGDLYVAVRSDDAAAAGIWRVPLSTFAGPRRVAALPTDSFPNGMAFDRRGRLYVADSSLGAVWRLLPGSTQPTIWRADALLEPTGETFMGFPLPGANGIELHHGAVFVSNTATRQILRIPIRRDGSAGSVQIIHRGIEADDFAFAAGGDLIVAENPPSVVVRVTPRGAVTTLASAADGLDNPSAVAVAEGRLYVTNAAYFGTRPSLQETRAPEPNQQCDRRG